MLIDFFYHILLFIGDPIFLGGFELGYEVLDILVLGAMFWGTARMHTLSWMADTNTE